MPIVAAHESSFETGLEILADIGFGGLKLAEVCSRLGVTSGSFYHYFASWGDYNRELVEYWRQDRTVRAIDVIRSDPTPGKRIEAIIYRSAFDIVGQPARAHTYASWAVDVFVGYEQSTLPKDLRMFAWICNAMLDDLEAGRFADVPT